MIYFEEIKPLHFWVIQWWLFKKEKIYFLRANKTCHNKYWFKSYISNGSLKENTASFRPGMFDGFHYDAAFDSTEDFFSGYLNKSALKCIRKLYGNFQSDLAFKKTLNYRLARFYYLNHVLGKIQEGHPGEKIIFIPSNGVELYRTDGCDIYDYDQFLSQAQCLENIELKAHTIKIFLWSRITSYINTVTRKLTLLIKIVAMPFWLILKCGANLKGFSRSKRSYDYAITIISPTRQLVNEIQKVDFLIDGKQIKKEQVVFIAPKGITKEGKKYFIENRLNFVNDLAGFISLKEIIKIFPAYWCLLCSVVKEKSFIGETSLKGIYFYAVWKSFSNNVAIKKFVTHCDYEVKALFRNIILEQNRCTTYLYMDSSNFGCFAVKKEMNSEFRHHYLGFLHYDWFISWNDTVVDYFQKSFCQFKRSTNLGCFWSEHVRLIKDGMLPAVSHLKNRLRENGYRDDMLLVAVFDSTFHDLSMTTYDDGINFLKGLYDLINDLPNAFFILKEKKSRHYHETISVRHEDINAMYEKLEGHPRCYCSGEKENSSEIVAFSDLTISFPFTSTTLEALCARKKAVWYDASGKFWDTYYDNIPGLVCHSYKELLARSKELLFEISENEYNEYLDAQVKGKVESYLDGNAITRFRNLLSNSFENPMEPIDMVRMPATETY